MASAQVEINEAAFEQLVKEAQGQAAEKVKEREEEQVFLTGQLRNATQGPVNLIAKSTWSGEYITPPPPVFAGNTTAHFEQVSKHEDGINSAVVYSGRNVGGQNQIGWLVACSNPKATQQNKKVYVDCGSIDKYYNIDWETIKKHLDTSTEDDSTHRDPFTRSAVRARILPPLTNNAATDGILVATFYG